MVIDPFSVVLIVFYDELDDYHMNFVMDGGGLECNRYFQVKVEFRTLLDPERNPLTAVPSWFPETKVS